MLRWFGTALALVGFLATSSGFALASHLHDADADHGDHRYCDVCYKLTAGSTSLPAPSGPVIGHAPVQSFDAPASFETPRSIEGHSPAAPRGPPA
jgi:hypothetical protein